MPQKRSDLALVAEIKKDDASISKAREIVIETIRSQDEQAKERGAADFLFKTIKKAAGLIQNAEKHGLKPFSLQRKKKGEPIFGSPSLL